MENEIGQKEKVSPKHVFLHLFVMVMLYASTANLLTLLFQYINYWVKDSISKVDYSLVYSGDLIRFSIASILIVFPLFVFTSWYLSKNYARLPALREMRTRKWLLYFTLFVSALIITGDLVQIILTFLNGEMTLRFILKALSVILVTGLIFYHYLRELKQPAPSSKTKYFVCGVAIAVLVAVVAGFFVVGSPQTQRARRFDGQRINNLQEIQWQIVNYWQSKETLPPSLGALTDNISGYRASIDPETGTAYEYNILNLESLSFELCATFNLPDETTDGGAAYMRENMAYPIGSINETWQHGAGRVCFPRAIDTQLYPPFSRNVEIKR